MDDRSVPELDDVTADRLLEGGVAPDDAPPGYQDVARALQAAALMASDAPTQEADTAVSAFLNAIPSRRTNRMKKWKIAAATLAGGLTLSTGLAAADVLPGPAQQAASSALSHVGIHVPDGGDDATNVSTTDKTEKSGDDDSATSTTHPDNHGSVVSDAAHDDSTVGRDHGAAVCTTASDGKCKAGAEHGKSSAEHGQSGEVRGGSSNTSSNSTNSGQGSANAEDGAANANDNGASSTAGSSTGSSSSTGGSSNSSGSTNSSGSGASTSSGSTTD